MSDNIDYSALKWIKKELDITLKDAGVALEKYVEENKKRKKELGDNIIEL